MMGENTAPEVTAAPAPFAPGTRVRHVGAGTYGTVRAVELVTPATGHRYIGDDAGWWVAVEADDGFRYACPARELAAALPVTEPRLTHWQDGSPVRLCGTDCRDDARDALEAGRVVSVHPVGRCGWCGHRAAHRRGDTCECFDTETGS